MTLRVCSSSCSCCARLSALAQQVQQALNEIEKQLDVIKAASFGVDVRERRNTDYPVIDAVIRYNDAMHALLFVRRRLSSFLLAEGITQEP